jgi:hypothetical protein
MIHEVDRLGKLSFVQVVENALDKAYESYDSSLDINIPQKWTTIYQWYNDRYLNPDSPMRHKLFGSK